MMHPSSNLDKTTLREQTDHIKNLAKECGFSLVGIAESVPLEEEMTRFSEWLERRYHAGLGYMERNQEKRTDVRNILPETRSVIVVAQNYYTPHQHVSLEELQHNNLGKISRYAWGDDYHDVIPPKLERVADEIKRLRPQAATKIYTDTGAILEKQWAVRAGIGWQGKHSNVISREIGSWFFIGIILTTAEFCYDAPIKDYCGNCTACLQACPTQAIVQPYVVDANRCIPYWTIETKPDSEIPPNIAQNLDSWLFGCDTCQDVCPWNRFQEPSNDERFQPRNRETALNLDIIQSMTQEDFSTRFRKSPLKRSKMAGLKRNAEALQTSWKKLQE
jgi:epoxyqueuosine reductase